MAKSKTQVEDGEFEIEDELDVDDLYSVLGSLMSISEAMADLKKELYPLSARQLTTGETTILRWDSPMSSRDVSNLLSELRNLLANGMKTLDEVQREMLRWKGLFQA